MTTEKTEFLLTARKDTESSDPTSTRIEIPDDIYVECPLVGKRLRALGVCVGCQHCAGLRERFQDERLRFAQRYQVACRFPFARGLFEVVSEEMQESTE